MWGLLYKDFLLIKHNLITGFLGIIATALALMIVIAGMNYGNFREVAETGNLYQIFYQACILFLYFGGIGTALMSASSIDQDHKAEWYKVLYASPVTPWTEICSRYIMGFAVNTLACVLISILLPFLYKVGNVDLTLSNYKAVLCCWLVGMILILLRLPLDIVYPANVSTAISLTVLAIVMFAFIFWNVNVDIEEVVITVKGWLDFILDHGVILMILLTLASFAFSYFGKKSRRWA